MQITHIILCLLLIGAHFLRVGNIILVVILLLSPLLLLLKKPVSARIVQVILLLGSVEWIRTIVMTVRFRIHIQQPWGRYMIIMGSVTFLTIAAAALFNLRNLKSRYRLD